MNDLDERQQLRALLRHERRQLSPAILQATALEINRYISNTSWFKRSRHIAFYQAVHGEIDLSRLIQQSWALGKKCYLPICHPIGQKRLLFVPYFQDEKCYYNRYGIPEPDLKKHAHCQPFFLDLVFIPLLAFDNQGNRLGSGKGYYDRTFSYLTRFAFSKPKLVGIAYDFQERAQLPTQPWDIQLDQTIIVKTG